MDYDGNYRDTSPQMAFRALEVPSRILKPILLPHFRRFNSGSKIIYYHEIDKSLFRSHIEYLEHHYNIVPLARLVSGIHSNEILDSNDVAIVFDDGRRTLYPEVLPIVEKYDVPITVFLVPTAIEEGVFFWDKVNALQKVGAVSKSVDDFAVLPPSERTDQLEKLLSEHGISFTRTALNWEEILEMQSKGVDFQAHSLSHPSLPAMSREVVEQEVLDSASEIEDKLDTDVDHFSYPFGHWSDTVEEVLRESDYLSSVGVVPGSNSRTTNPYNLRRVGVETASAALLSMLMEGVWHKLVPGKHFQSMPS